MAERCISLPLSRVMSVSLFDDDVQFLQRILCSAACYAGPITGKWDPVTDAAEEAFTTQGDQIANEVGRFDERSERRVPAPSLLTWRPECSPVGRLSCWAGGRALSLCCALQGDVVCISQ